MSICSIGVAMGRIKVANEKSPISIFKVYGAHFEVNAVFTDTIMTKSLEGSKDLIGHYHKNMKMNVVQDEIVEACAE